MVMVTNTITEEKRKSMLKAVMEIAGINKTMKLNFGLIVKPDASNPKSAFYQLENKFNYGDNYYYKLRPSPFLVIDISNGRDKRDDSRDPYWSVSLNRLKVFELINKLKKFINDFRDYKNLFYYDQNDQIKLDTNIAKKVMIDFYTANKHVRFFPCVVNGEGEEEQYEGCMFCINTYDHFCTLTIDEMEYLLYELMNVNMNVLTLEILLLVKDYKKEVEEKGINEINLNQTVEEENEKETETVAKVEDTSIKL